MNMNKLLLAVLLLGAGVGVSHADNDTIRAPRDSKGATVHPLYGGFKATRVASTTEALICSGRCILGGLYMSSGAAASYARIRDTGTADGTLVLTALVMNLGFVDTNTAAHGNKISAPIRSEN